MMTFQPVSYSGSRLDASIELGQQIADKWGTSSLLIQMARDITKEWRTRNRLDEARAIYSWVNRRVRYVPDPINAEMIGDPLTTIKNGGDCDDMAVLACALLQAIGHDARVGAVTWKGRDSASHAVAVDLTAQCIVDPVGNTPEAWPPAPYEVQSIKYRDKAGNMQAMNGLFSKVVKALAKPFQKVFPAKTLLGKIVDPLGLTDPKRNLNLVGRVADVVGTAAAVAAGGWAIGAASGTTAGLGFWATAAKGGALAAAKLGLAAKTIGAELATVAASSMAGGAQAAPEVIGNTGGMTPEQTAAWMQYGGQAQEGQAAYGGSGGGGGAGFFAPEGTPAEMPTGQTTSYAIPLAIAAVAGLYFLTTSSKKRSA